MLREVNIKIKLLINNLIFILYFFRNDILLNLKLINVNNIKIGINIILKIVIWFGIFIIYFYFLLIYFC